MENRARKQTGPRYVIQLERAAREFEGLPAQAQRVLRLCDGKRSVRALHAASGLSAKLFTRVLHRLISLGLASELGEPSRAKPVTHEVAALPAPGASRVEVSFSREEEAFFSRTIDHLLEPEERIASFA